LVIFLGQLGITA